MFSSGDEFMREKYRSQANGHDLVRCESQMSAFDYKCVGTPFLNSYS